MITDRFSHVSCGEFHSAAVAHCPEPRLLVWGDCDHLLSHDEMGRGAGVSESSSKALKCDVTRLLSSPGGGGGGGVRIRQVGQLLLNECFDLLMLSKVACGADTVLVLTD
jgi:hypothetical protein